eukprot:6977774-Prymnesium_polylepis.1
MDATDFGRGQHATSSECTGKRGAGTPFAHTACSGQPSDGRVAHRRFEDAPTDDCALSVCISSDRRVAIEL